MSNHAATTRWKCLFFGMPCAFASPILSALERPDVDLVGVVTRGVLAPGDSYTVIPGRPPVRNLPIAQVTGTFGAQFSAPRYIVRNFRDERLHQILRELEPDLIVVACFPGLIPATICNAARIVAINVHPSLLPRHRGPDPLFGTFREGDDRTGVTIHVLSAEFDAGEILLQVETPIDHDESLPVLELRLARIAAGMVTDLIDGLPHLPPARPQRPDHLTRSWPTSDDRVIDATWTVQQARRFITGIAGSHGNVAYRQNDKTRIVIKELSNRPSDPEIVLADGRLRVTGDDTVS